MFLSDGLSAQFAMYNTRNDGHKSAIFELDQVGHFSGNYPSLKLHILFYNDLAIWHSLSDITRGY